MPGVFDVANLFQIWYKPIVHLFYFFCNSCDSGLQHTIVSIPFDIAFTLRLLESCKLYCTILVILELVSVLSIVFLLPKFEMLFSFFFSFEDLPRPARSVWIQVFIIAMVGKVIILTIFNLSSLHHF